MHHSSQMLTPDKELRGHLPHVSMFINIWFLLVFAIGQRKIKNILGESQGSEFTNNIYIPTIYQYYQLQINTW